MTQLGTNPKFAPFASSSSAEEDDDEEADAMAFSIDDPVYVSVHLISRPGPVGNMARNASVRYILETHFEQAIAGPVEYDPQGGVTVFKLLCANQSQANKWMNPLHWKHVSDRLHKAAMCSLLRVTSIDEDDDNVIVVGASAI